jgi:hypothetical protein
MMKKFIISFLAMLVFILVSCDDKFFGLPVTYTVKYEITGTASRVDITMSNADGGTEQFSNVSVPWEKSFSVEIEKDNYFFAYVSAQNQGTTGSVTAKIYKDGSQFKSSTSSGAYVIATASGSIDY